MAQLEMFAQGEVLATAGTARRVAWTPPEFAPFPDALARRLEGDLRELQSAQWSPWRPEYAAEEIDKFLSCVARLPPEKRGDLADRFQAELNRLGLTARQGA